MRDPDPQTAITHALSLGVNHVHDGLLVDTTTKAFPKLELNRPTEPVKRVLEQPVLVDDRSLTGMISSQVKFLHQVRKSVGATDFDLGMAFRSDGTERDVLDSTIVDGNLPIAIGIFSLLEQLKSRFDRTIEDIRNIHTGNVCRNKN